MPSSRSCRSSYDCIVKIKGVTTRPILFSQLMRSDGEGAMNPEELFADDRSPASEQERVHEDELHSLMRSILDWAISFLSEPSQGTIRAIYFEGKTVKQHSEEEYVTVYAIYKRLTCKGVVPLRIFRKFADSRRDHRRYRSTSCPPSLRAAIRLGNACGPTRFRLCISAWRSPASARISRRGTCRRRGFAADPPVQPLDGVVRPDPGPMLHGEVGVGERLGAAPAHDLGCREQLHRLE